LRHELGLPQNKTIVMHTGSLFAGRGAELFDSVIRNFPELCFVQVGGKPVDIKNWQEHYKNYSNITFIGHQGNTTLIKYQMAADLMFLPMTKASKIWWCTSPMKLFEYMATGNPICTSRVGSLCEVVNEANSLQFDPENEQSIISAIQYFIDNREDCTKLGSLCLAEVRKDYSWQKRIDRICRFIF